MKFIDAYESWQFKPDQGAPTTKFRHFGRWAKGPAEVVYAFIQFGRALDSDNSGLDRTIRRVYGSTLLVRGAHGLAESRAQLAMIVRNNGLEGLPRWLDNTLPTHGTNVPRYAGARPAAGYLYEANKPTLRAGTRRLPLLKAAAAFSVFKEGYDTVDSLRTGRQIEAAGYALMTLSSGVGLAKALGVAAAGGPVGWAAAALYIVGAALVYQGQRVHASNRFENVDARRFLSHIGSIDPATGLLRDPHSSSEAKDHNPDYFDFEVGDEQRDDRIVYRGISANAVDELMNNSSDPSDPLVAAPALGELAHRHGISGRELVMTWFDQLTPEQQKHLPPLTFSVDLDDPDLDHDSVRLDYFYDASKDNLLGTLAALEVAGEITETQREELENFLAGEYRNLNPYADDDSYDALDGISAEQFHDWIVNGGDNLPERIDLVASIYMENQPQTVAELDVMLETIGYPPIPDAELADLPDVPVPEAAQPERFFEPYVVQPGDSIWSIAEQVAAETGMTTEQALAHLYEQNASLASPNRQFDPDRADSDFFSGHASNNPLRDPDLVHPGDRIVIGSIPVEVSGE